MSLGVLSRSQAGMGYPASLRSASKDSSSAFIRMGFHLLPFRGREGYAFSQYGIATRMGWLAAVRAGSRFVISYLRSKTREAHICVCASPFGSVFLMAGAVQRAARAAAATGGLAPFFIPNQIRNDQRRDHQQNGTYKNGSKIHCNPNQHIKPLLRYGLSCNPYFLSLKKPMTILIPRMNPTARTAKIVMSAVPKVRFAVTLYTLPAARTASPGADSDRGGTVNRAHRPEPQRQRRSPR